MSSVNNCVFVGRLTRDPEVRDVASGMRMVTFDIAVDRPKGKNSQNAEKVTDFIRCKAWRETANFIAEFIGKGRMVCVIGSLNIDRVAANDGGKDIYFTSINVNNLQALDAKPGNQNADGGNGYQPDYNDNQQQPQQNRQQRQGYGNQPANGQQQQQRPQTQAAPRQQPQPAQYSNDDFQDPYADE